MSSYYTQEDTLLTVPIDGVLGNDTDPTNDPLTAIKVDDVSNGALTFSADGSFTYNPDSNFNGADSFTYYASDGINNSDPVTVTINVDPVNDPPTAIADSYDVQEGTMLDVVAPGILSNDTDPEDDPLTAIKVDDVSNGALTFSADGSFTYTPNAGATNDSFTYHAFDGTNSNIVTVTINVIPDAATNIFVEDSIGYTTNGGKDGTKHLTHIIHFIDDDGISVSGAIVAITLTNLDTDSSWPGTGTTDENGFVSFTLKNAPTGCYTTTVESVDSALVWDDITPSNNHGLRTSC
jgi:VCBS repeat-containing protein